MSIALSSIPLNSAGVPMLPKRYQNGIATISAFGVDRTLLIPIGQDLSPGYNAVGTFYIISNDGDDFAKPKLTIARANGDMLNVKTGEQVSSIDVAFGETLILGMEDASQTLASAILLSGSSGGEYVLPPATMSTLGGVKVGNNLSVTTDGTISAGAPYTLPAATIASLGGITLGQGLSTDSPTKVIGQKINYINTPSASIEVGFNIVNSTQFGAGTLPSTAATGSVVEVLNMADQDLALSIPLNISLYRADGTRITGTLSIPQEHMWQGIFYGANAIVELMPSTDVVNPVNNIPVATNTVAGKVKAGLGLIVSADGTLDVSTHEIHINVYSGDLPIGTVFYEDAQSIEDAVTMPDPNTITNNASIRIISATPGVTPQFTLGTNCNIYYIDGTSGGAGTTFSMPPGTFAEFMCSGNYWYQIDGEVTKP